MSKLSSLQRFRLDKPGKVRLARFDPAATPCSLGDGPPEKLQDRARTAALTHELGLLQDRFYALHDAKLLLVLQGMDTSGKDGTIRTVFQTIDPLGVRAVSYRTPTEAERDRDFLWRHHRDVPGKGEIVIFNRSHYEAVLIEWVHGWIDDKERKRRFAHINTFEKMLAQTGTTVVKCFLHISKGEQRRRLQERIDDSSKHWKFDLRDLAERKLWDRYQRAYDDVLEETASRWAPWYVVPADNKAHRNLMVTEILLARLRELARHDPPANPKLKGVLVR
jgi:PPK2 family polyphosphate:nucleotide phosphotransferase